MNRTPAGLDDELQPDEEREADDRRPATERAPGIGARPALNTEPAETAAPMSWSVVNGSSHSQTGPSSADRIARPTQP